jgi:hypothetical protein
MSLFINTSIPNSSLECGNIILLLKINVYINKTTLLNHVSSRCDMPVLMIDLPTI